MDFLEEVFHKLLLNFTWWVNRKDLEEEGRNTFQGSFLGLDNIGVFDRSRPEGLPEGANLEQADGTAWMGVYCLEMLAIALELSKTRPAYEATATKFFEHFVAIAHAINGMGGRIGMWDEEDGFFYDVIRGGDGVATHVKLRSFVGLIPLFAVHTLESDVKKRLPKFWARVEWYLKYRPTLAGNASLLTEPGTDRRGRAALPGRSLASLPRDDSDARPGAIPVRLRPPLPLQGARAIPLRVRGPTLSPTDPAESASPIYGGNSNWRGPIWFPVNYLMVDVPERLPRLLRRTTSWSRPYAFGIQGRLFTLKQTSDEIARRLRLDLSSKRSRPRPHAPSSALTPLFQDDPL